MNWIELKSAEQLNDIQKDNEPCILFKHSTRCAVSSMAKKNFQLESVLLPSEIKVYLLDLIKYRGLSKQIEEMWVVKHESPQVLLIQGKECKFNASHNDIRVADVALTLQNYLFTS